MLLRIFPTFIFVDFDLNVDTVNVRISGYCLCGLYSRSSSAGILLAFPSRKTKRTLGDRSFSLAAPTLWNKLPRELRDLEDFNSFKQKLKGD